MATTKEQSDVVAYVAHCDSDGNTRVTFRYIDGTTKTFENGSTTPVDEGVASETITWWR